MQLSFGLLVALHMMGWTLQADEGAPSRVRALGWPRVHTPSIAPVLGMLSQYALAVFTVLRRHDLRAAWQSDAL